MSDADPNARLNGWLAMNTPEQVEDLVWSDTPQLPAQLPRALGELARRVEHNAFNNGR